MKVYKSDRRNFPSNELAFDFKEINNIEAFQINDDSVDLSNALGKLNLGYTNADAASHIDIGKWIAQRNWVVYAIKNGNKYRITETGVTYSSFAGDGLKFDSINTIETQVIQWAKQGGFRVNPEDRTGTEEGDTNIDDFDDAIAAMGISGFRFVRSDVDGQPTEDETTEDEETATDEPVSGDQPQKGIFERNKQLSLLGVGALILIAWRLSQ